MSKAYLLTFFSDPSSPNVGTCIRFNTLDELKQHVAGEAVKPNSEQLDSYLVFEGIEGKLAIDRKPKVTIEGLEAPEVARLPKKAEPPVAAFEPPKRGRPFGSKNKNHRN